MGQSFQFEFTHDFELQDHNVFMCVQEYNVFLLLIWLTLENYVM